MALGKRKRASQGELWVATQNLTAPGHPFYQQLNKVLDEHDFDTFVEARCSQYYAGNVGRPGVAPGVYFRMLMIGFFEGLDSERGIAWRVADSLSLRQFLGYELDKSTPEHSTLSRTRRLIDLQTHADVFEWVLKVLAQAKLLKGKTLGVDATTVDANAAMRSIVRRDTGEGYEEFLTRLAQASGIETPTREELAKIDKKRPKKGSNKDWEHPHDPDARITKMKDGRTHLAHKVEQAVDMDTQAIVAVTLTGADEDDRHSLPWTFFRAGLNLEAVAQDPEASKRLHAQPLSEVVADKGYHSNEVLVDLQSHGTRSYISEPDRGRRKWKDKADAQRAVYANRRRIRGERGQALRRKRGELLERPFAHLFETGGMRRLFLRHRDNILKRLLLHVSAWNLGLIMRQLVGKGTPRGMGRAFSLLTMIAGCYFALAKPLLKHIRRTTDSLPLMMRSTNRAAVRSHHCITDCLATGC
jgi:transposase